MAIRSHDVGVVVLDETPLHRHRQVRAQRDAPYLDLRPALDNLQDRFGIVAVTRDQPHEAGVGRSRRRTRVGAITGKGTKATANEPAVESALGAQQGGEADPRVRQRLAPNLR